MPRKSFYATAVTMGGFATGLVVGSQDSQPPHLAREQYYRGLIIFLNVLDAERNLLMAQDEVEQSDQMISIDLVVLYKALGGGLKQD